MQKSTTMIQGIRLQSLSFAFDHKNISLYLIIPARKAIYMYIYSCSFVLQQGTEVKVCAYARKLCFKSVSKLLENVVFVSTLLLEKNLETGILILFASTSIYKQQHSSKKVFIAQVIKMVPSLRNKHFPVKHKIDY